MSLTTTRKIKVSIRGIQMGVLSNKSPLFFKSKIHGCQHTNKTKQVFIMKGFL